MGEEPRGIEKVLTAGPPQAQVSVRMLLPILFAILATELVAIGVLGKLAESTFEDLQMKELPPATNAALNSARLHRSVPGLVGAVGVLVVLVVLCRKGVFDSTGRWLCLALILGLAVYPVCFVASILLPMQRVQYSLSR